MLTIPKFSPNPMLQLVILTLSASQSATFSIDQSVDQSLYKSVSHSSLLHERKAALYYRHILWSCRIIFARYFPKEMILF